MEGVLHPPQLRSLEEVPRPLRGCGGDTHILEVAEGVEGEVRAESSALLEEFGEVQVCDSDEPICAYEGEGTEWDDTRGKWLRCYGPLSTNLHNE